MPDLSAVPNVNAPELDRKRRSLLAPVRATAGATIAELLGGGNVRRLALPSNFRYGQAIFRRGGVEFMVLSSSKVEGWVGGLGGSVDEGGGQRRRVELAATRQGLKWHCTGNPRNHQMFCKHCVALALATLKESRKYRL
jgi:uncharacterized Zn finger protein